MLEVGSYFTLFAAIAVCLVKLSHIQFESFKLDIAKDIKFKKNI